MVRTSTLTYPAAGQDTPGAWSTLVQRRSRYCFRHDPSRSQGCKAFSDADSYVFQPVGDPHWAGVSPFATDSVGATPDVSGNAADARTLY
jgi:hypothetical protein